MKNVRQKNFDRHFSKTDGVEHKKCKHPVVVAEWVDERLQIQVAESYR